jgi:hypothetical protein
MSLRRMQDQDPRVKMCSQIPWERPRNTSSKCCTMTTTSLNYGLALLTIQRHHLAPRRSGTRMIRKHL